MKTDTVIAEEPPRDGREWDCCCARCGGQMDFERCGWCDGDGLTEEGELYEEDPLFYSPSDRTTCHECGGAGGDRFCGNSQEWCEANPLPGREKVERNTAEWFTIEHPKFED